MSRTKISFFLMLCITASAQALIVTTDSIETVYDYCQQKNSILCIDLDETIGLRVFDPHLKKYWLSKVLLKPFQLGFFDRLHFVQKLNPMELSTLPLLKKLQDQHEPIIIITARPIDIATQTELQLHSLGFDPSVNNLINSSEQPIAKDAVLKNEIIYCSSQEKGPILLAFLHQNNLTPDVVIYADNLLKHVTSVHDTLMAAGIKCIGIHYTRENLLPYFSSLRELF